MDNNFENITPWDGTKDTGRDVRLKWERNFSRVKANFEEVSGKLAAAGIPRVAYQDIDGLTDPLSSPGLYLMDFGGSLPVVCGILEVYTTWGMNGIQQKLKGGFVLGGEWEGQDINSDAEYPVMTNGEIRTFTRRMELASGEPSGGWSEWEEELPPEVPSMEGYVKAVEWPGAVISEFTVTPQGLLDPTGGEVALAVKKGDASLGAEGGEPQGFVLLKGGKAYSVWLEGGGIPSSEYYNAGQDYSGMTAIEWPDGTVYVATGEPWSDLDGWNIGTGLDITHVDRREKAVYIASGGALKKVYGESDVIPRYVEWPGIVADSDVEVTSESVYPDSSSTVALQLDSSGKPWRFVLKTANVFYNNWAAGTGIDGAIPPATDYQMGGSFLPNTIYRGRGDTLDLIGGGVELLPECVFFTDSQCAMHKLWQKDADAAEVAQALRGHGAVAELMEFRPDGTEQMELVYNRLLDEDLEYSEEHTITLPGASETSPGAMSAADKKKLDGTPATVVFGDLVNSGMANGAAVDWSYFAPYTSYDSFKAAVVGGNTLFYARIQTPDNGLHATLVPAIVTLNEEDFIDITVVYGNYAPCVYHAAIYNDGKANDIIHKKIALGNDIT